MIPSRPTRLILPLAAGLCLAGCVKTGPVPQNTAEPSEQTKPFAERVVQTVKTGAAVSLVSQQRYAIETDETGIVDIDILEAYTSGTLILEANGTDSLDVFGASRTLRLDMSDTDQHSWSLQFTAREDGVHYISVLASPEGVEGPELKRAFAVRVEVGDLAAAAAKPRNDVALETLPSGESVVVMPAEETIK